MTLTTTKATSVTPRRAKRRRPTVGTYVRRWLLVLSLALVTFVGVTLVPGLLAPSDYFDGGTGAGLGASHQTGWTALVADLICRG